MRSFINREGNKSIKSMYVARQPVHSGIQKFLDVLSFGNYSKRKKKLGYDDVYHNYLIVELENGKKYKIEKNHVVETREASKSDLSNEKYLVPLLDRDIKLDKLIGNAAKDDSKFWRYDPANKNCQWFVQDVLENNGLDRNITDKKAKEVVKPQDGIALLDSLGSLSTVPKMVTDFTASADTYIYGQGIKKKITVDQLFDLANK